MTNIADTPVLEFTSHIAGKNAKVRVFRDRIEWSRKGWIGAKTRHITGAATMGMSYLVTGVKTRDDGAVIPIKSISSVTAKRGLRNTLLTFITTGNTLEMNVSHKEAEAVKDLVQTLMLSPAAPLPQQPAPVDPAQSDVAAELQKFAALRDQGVITADDFEAKKRQLLGL